MKKTLFAALFITALFSQSAQAQIITTIAGNGTAGWSGDGSAATSAELSYPFGIAIDANDNIYIADYANQRIRKIDTLGFINTIAGNGTGDYSGDGGAATAAEIYNPSDVAVDGSGNIYIADNFNYRVRKVTPAGIITTIAGNGIAGFSGDGGAATAAELSGITAVAIDLNGSIYIADEGNSRIRKVDTSGIITTIAGNGMYGYSGNGGAATAAKMAHPSGIAVSRKGNIYISDKSTATIRKVDASGIITTIAGTLTSGFSGDGGLATTAELGNPQHIVVDNNENIYIADAYNNRIRKIDTFGIITTIAGNGTDGFSGDGGAAIDAEIANPYGIAFSGSGNMYVADANNNRVRKVTGVATAITTINTNNFAADIFPNPAINKITISYARANNIVNITLTDITGKTLYTTTTDKKEGSITLPLQNVAPGVYIVIIQSGNQKVISKLVKE